MFSGNSLERSVNTGMTLCAFAANDTSETVVAANVSGKAAIVNVNTGKVDVYKRQAVVLAVKKRKNS